jgi:hypothetical protein
MLLASPARCGGKILILPDPAQLICAIRMVRGIAVGAGRAHLGYICNFPEQQQ